jgi:hypothetical protein
MYTPVDMCPDRNRNEHETWSAAIARRDARPNPPLDAVSAAEDAELKGDTRRMRSSRGRTRVDWRRSSVLANTRCDPPRNKSEAHRFTLVGFFAFVFQAGPH